MSLKGFNYEEWAKSGANPDSLPPNERMKLRAAWDSTPAQDPLEGILRGNTNNDDEDAPLRRSDVMNLFNEAQKRAQYEAELNSIKSSLGDRYNEYASAARPLIDRGYSPKDAFKLVSVDDAIAAAEDKARKDALSGLQAGARNAEQPVRGNGATGSGVSSNEGQSGNSYIADPELYKKERNRLRSAKTDFRDAVKFRADNPSFVEAEKHYGDLKGISRR